MKYVCHTHNFQWWEYENDHKKYPEHIMMGTESVPKEAAQNWDLIEKHPYIIGDFVWTAMDYLGESGIGHTTCKEEKGNNLCRGHGSMPIAGISI